jgi:hypothetical protein
MDQRIEARIAALENEISSLRALLAQQGDDGPPTSGRRGMVKLLAASAVGAVTGAALLNAQPAAAADGDNLKLGEINNSESPTNINNNVAGSVLVLNSQTGYGLEASGTPGNVLFSGLGAAPLGSAGDLGALYVDGAGDWWAATVSDPTNGGWRKLAGPGSAGQLHLLDAPVRVYDSRPGQEPVAVEPKAPTAPNEARTIDATLGGTAVPPTANAVLLTLTINAPQAPGFATVWPTGPWPGTSNVNFSPNQDIAATAIVGCGPNATVQVLSNTVTNIIIDVSGYYQ